MDFFHFSLTEREKRDRDYKKQLLQIAKDHEKARELERVQRYRMPENMKKGEKGEILVIFTFYELNECLLMLSLISEDYYEVDEREKHPNSEQKKWEAEQLASAMFKFGAKDAKRQQDDDYELILEDQIEFIQHITLDGTKKKDDDKKVTEQQKKRMDIKETKLSLPVYPFRNDLIAAIREHQVSLTVIPVFPPEIH